MIYVNNPRRSGKNKLQLVPVKILANTSNDLYTSLCLSAETRNPNLNIITIDGTTMNVAKDHEGVQMSEDMEKARDGEELVTTRMCGA